MEEAAAKAAAELQAANDEAAAAQAAAYAEARAVHAKAVAEWEAANAAIQAQNETATAAAALAKSTPPLTHARRRALLGREMGEASGAHAERLSGAPLSRSAPRKGG